MVSAFLWLFAVFAFWVDEQGGGQPQHLVIVRVQGTPYLFIDLVHNKEEISKMSPELPGITSAVNILCW
jgi:hypothetical protein